MAGLIVPATSGIKAMANDADTVELPPHLATGLDEIASRTGRSRSELMIEAVAEFLDVQRWQIEGIEEAIREDDSGLPGIPHEQVKAWVESWDTDEELPPPA
jgi:RHH-type rel operon transcriptional repressor/antitoxin RelB